MEAIKPHEESLGERFEGWAFTFCKAAFLALLFQKYTLLATAGIALVLYIAALSKGVDQWRCWLKPPWVVIAMGAILAWQIYIVFVARAPLRAFF